MKSLVNRWRDAAWMDPVDSPSAANPRSAPRPRNSLLLQAALACCSAACIEAARAQDTAPWRVVSVEIGSYVRSSESGSGYGYASCEYAVDSEYESWSSLEGLQGTFASGTSISYECCSKGGYYYGYSYDCSTYSLGVGGSIFVGPDSISVSPGSCMEYEICSSSVWFTVVLDRPMRMVWGDCCSGSDCCYDEGCPIDGSTCGQGSLEFPGAYLVLKDGYPVFHQLTSYSFGLGGGSGEFSFATDIRFERMYPADVMPDGIVNGFDLSAILSKWGSGYDPQRTPEDVNLDGQVNAEDLAAVLFAWGTPG